MTPPRQRRRLTLGQYIRRRNGVPAGAAGSLRNMLHRSFGAGSPGGFWRFWNPVFGYYLGRYLYAPMRRRMPDSLALITTFVACGALHDVVTMAVRGSVAFLFIPWFFFLALGVLLGRRLKMDAADRPWAVRAGLNVAYLLVCLLGAVAVQQALAGWIGL